MIPTKCSACARPFGEPVLSNGRLYWTCSDQTCKQYASLQHSEPADYLERHKLELERLEAERLLALLAEPPEKESPPSDPEPWPPGHPVNVPHPYLEKVVDARTPEKIEAERLQADVDSLEHPDDDQVTLFGELGPEADKAWRREWTGMPEFDNADLAPFRSIIMHFRNSADVAAFSRLIDQKILPKKDSYWHPPITIRPYANKRYVDESSL